ncbi:hypothetical protein DB345_03190 [Spartobacteria bacterium LR76]|nr:hypothetical protein DB345_03190 [Spartobacteria bacterium LR76]
MLDMSPAWQSLSQFAFWIRQALRFQMWELLIRCLVMGREGASRPLQHGREALIFQVTMAK